jgi:hypothetical protein
MENVYVPLLVGLISNVEQMVVEELAARALLLMFVRTENVYVCLIAQEKFVVLMVAGECVEHALLLMFVRTENVYVFRIVLGKIVVLMVVEGHAARVLHPTPVRTERAHALLSVKGKDAVLMDVEGHAARVPLETHAQMVCVMDRDGPAPIKGVHRGVNILVPRNVLIRVPAHLMSSLSLLETTQ